MSATPAGAQTVAVKEKPPLFRSAEGFTHDNWWQAKSIAGFMKVLKAVHEAGGSSSTKHWDQIYISHFYNWNAGSWKGAPFEAPARGVIVSSSSQSPVAVRHCADCGATLPSAQRRQQRCAECAADGV